LEEIRGPVGFGETKLPPLGLPFILLVRPWLKAFLLPKKGTPLGGLELLGFNYSNY